MCELDLLSEIMLNTILTLEIHYRQLQQTIQEGQDSLPRCPSPNMASTTEEGWHWINIRDQEGWSLTLHPYIHIYIKKNIYTGLHKPISVWMLIQNRKWISNQAFKISAGSSWYLTHRNKHNVSMYVLTSQYHYLMLTAQDIDHHQVSAILCRSPSYLIGSRN